MSAAPIPRYQDLKAKGATPERPGVSIEWFNAIYQVLLGEPRGPRFGSFVALYGVKETRALIAKALAGDLVQRARGLSERAGNRARGLNGALRGALPAYCRAHMIRATQATSSIGMARSSCSGLSDTSSRLLAERRLQFLGQNLPGGGAHDHPVALADAGRRRQDEHVTVAVERCHGIAGDFEGENLLLRRNPESRSRPIPAHCWAGPHR